MNKQGFTLIELIVVVAVIGILAAIAIPQFSNYRKQGFDAAARADLHNAALAEESLFARGSAYVNCRNNNCNQRLPGFHRSTNVAIRMRRAGATATSFTGTSSHPNGTGTVFTYDSAAGGMQ